MDVCCLSTHSDANSCQLGVTSWRTSICREYSIGLRCELERRVAGVDETRSAELAAYFTHAALQPGHAVLALRSAMVLFYKLKNYATGATFCRRLLELNAPQKACPTPTSKSRGLAERASSGHN